MIKNHVIILMYEVEKVEKYSVLMSVYKNDDPEFFKDALYSIINQTVKPDEIVLVIDGEISQTLMIIINEYAEKNSALRIIKLEENVGLGNALKIGLEHCSNELIARMDSDDISVSNRFEKQIECFRQDSKLSIVGGFISEFINEVDNVVGVRDVPLTDGEIKIYMKKRCPLNHVSVMFKKSEVMQVGGFIDWHYNEDYYLWIRMQIGNCKFLNIPEILVNVRVGEDMYRRRGGWRYFISEAKLQGYMLSEGIIALPRYIYNTAVRLFIQVILPDKIRGFLFQKLFRKKEIKLIDTNNSLRDKPYVKAM